MFAFLRSRRSAPRGGETGPTVDDAPLLERLAEAHDAAAAEADASFTPERAAAQRATILARLGATADPRVLSFPPRAVDAAPAGPRGASPRPALGWMLTAAAAGLIVGVGTGQGLYLEWQPGDALVGANGAARPVSAPVRSTTPVVTAPAPSEADDAVLLDVEVALAERGVDELQPLDALTPRVTLVASR